MFSTIRQVCEDCKSFLLALCQEKFWFLSLQSLVHIVWLHYSVYRLFCNILVPYRIVLSNSGWIYYPTLSFMDIRKPWEPHICQYTRKMKHWLKYQLLLHIYIDIGSKSDISRTLFLTMPIYLSWEKPTKFLHSVARSVFVCVCARVCVCQCVCVCACLCARLVSRLWQLRPCAPGLKIY